MKNKENNCKINEKEEIIKEFSKILYNKNENDLIVAKGVTDFIFSLDNYSLQSQKFTSKTLKIRDKVLNNQKLSLVFKDIEKIIDKKDVKFIMAELKNSYSNLLKEMFNFTLKAFGVKCKNDLLETFLNSKEYIENPQLKALFENINNSINDKIFTEKIASEINKNKHPKNWNSEDLANFKIKIKELGFKFQIIATTTHYSNITMNTATQKLFLKILELNLPQRNVLLRNLVNESI